MATVDVSAARAVATVDVSVATVDVSVASADVSAARAVASADVSAARAVASADATTVTAIVPVLRIFDLDEARRFYVDYLGFAIDWVHRFADDLPAYLQLHRDAVVLHLSEHHGDGCPGAHVRLACDDIARLHADLTARPHPRLRPGLETQPWGERSVTVIDPFGNRLVFYTSLKEPVSP